LSSVALAKEEGGGVVDMTRTIIFKIILNLWFALWLPILLVGLVSRKLTRKLIVWDAYGVLFIARIIGGIKYKIHNQPEKIEGIIAAKHASVLEVGILGISVPNSFFILKKELLYIPIYGWAFARMGFVPVNRKAGTTGMRSMQAAVERQIAKGGTLVIYPEGTRALPGQPVKLKRGLLFLAENLKLPIQPIGTDAGKFWPKKGLVRPGTANVWFEKPLPYNASLDEIAEALGKHSA
jgi:1-acyl-sn-glycerol-3-phosphate acyltransferase